MRASWSRALLRDFQARGRWRSAQWPRRAANRRRPSNASKPSFSPSHVRRPVLSAARRARAGRPRPVDERPGGGEQIGRSVRHSGSEWARSAGRRRPPAAWDFSALIAFTPSMMAFRSSCADFAACIRTRNAIASMSEFPRSPRTSNLVPPADPVLPAGVLWFFLNFVRAAPVRRRRRPGQVTGQAPAPVRRPTRGAAAKPGFAAGSCAPQGPAEGWPRKRRRFRSRR